MCSSIHQYLHVTLSMYSIIYNLGVTFRDMPKGAHPIMCNVPKCNINYNIVWPVLYQDGGLYNRLYLCLYDLVADLVRLANGDSVSK